MHNYNSTSAQRKQRIPLVKPKKLSSAPEGNVGSIGRDFSRGISTGLRLACFNDADNSFTLFVAPGEFFGRQARREIEAEFKKVARADNPRRSAEIEFSASPSAVFKAASGLPEDYRTSVIDWALGLCRSVAVCVDIAPGTPEGEPYRRFSPIQASFHCAADQVDVWVDYLGRRIRPTHHFAVVRFETSETRL